MTKTSDRQFQLPKLPKDFRFPNAGKLPTQGPSASKPKAGKPTKASAEKRIGTVKSKAPIKIKRRAY